MKKRILPYILLGAGLASALSGCIKEKDKVNFSNRNKPALVIVGEEDKYGKYIETSFYDYNRDKKTVERYIEKVLLTEKALLDYETDINERMIITDLRRDRMTKQVRKLVDKNYQNALAGKLLKGQKKIKRSI